MVEIRKLRPLVSIRRPGASEAPSSARRVPARVERRRIDFLPPTPQPTPCVLWQGIVDRDGYGRLKVPGEDGRLVPTGPHRWVMDQLRFAETGRHLRPDEFVLHLCDNPPCFRVDHLEVGSVQQNNQQMFDRGRASPPPRNVFYGEEHPGAKLTTRDVRSIRSRYQSGLSVRTLADQFGVGPTAVRRIVRGVTWASVPPDGDRFGESGEDRFTPGVPATGVKRTRRVKPFGGC